MKLKVSDISNIKEVKEMSQLDLYLFIKGLIGKFQIYQGIDLKAETLTLMPQTCHIGVHQELLALKRSDRASEVKIDWFYIEKKLKRESVQCRKSIWLRGCLTFIFDKKLSPEEDAFLARYGLKMYYSYPCDRLVTFYQDLLSKYTLFKSDECFYIPVTVIGIVRQGSSTHKKFGGDVKAWIEEYYSRMGYQSLDHFECGEKLAFSGHLEFLDSDIRMLKSYGILFF